MMNVASTIVLLTATTLALLAGVSATMPAARPEVRLPSPPAAVAVRAIPSAPLRFRVDKHDTYVLQLTLVVDDASRPIVFQKIRRGVSATVALELTSDQGVERHERVLTSQLPNTTGHGSIDFKLVHVTLRPGDYSAVLTGINVPPELNGVPVKLGIVRPYQGK
jgi:hypothetical protein